MPISYSVNDTALIFNTSDDLNDAKELLSNQGVFGLEKKSKETVDNSETKKMAITKIAIEDKKNGEVEILEIEPELMDSLPIEEDESEMNGREGNEDSEDIEQIDTNQSKSQIKSQLQNMLQEKYPKALTHSNIFKVAQEAGLVQSMEKCDVISIMNDIAVDVGLPRIDFSSYWSPEDVTEDADMSSSGNDSHVGFNESDNYDEGIKEFMSSFDNTAEELFSIDRILEERLRNFVDPEKLINDSFDKVKEAIKKSKKNSIPSRYLFQNIKVDEIDRAGKVISGKITYAVRLKNKANYKEERTIVVPMNIKARQVMEPTEFIINNKNYPLAPYYLNDLFD